MKARRAFVALLVAAALGGCTSRSKAPTTSGLAPGSSEAPVAVTVPTGQERLPIWERHERQAILVVPSDLLFARDSADLGPAAVGVLGQVLDEAHFAARVLVEGHADSDGDPGHNQELSERRAAAVGDWLAVNGVDPSAVTTRGWGETRPAVEEMDEATKAQNRRVVVTVTVPAAA